jgi:hypothetical protein
MATNYNAPGPWNNFNPVGKYTASSSAMPSGNDRAAYEKKMADVYSNVRVGTDILGNPIRGYTGTTNNSTGVNQSRAGTLAPGINSQPTGGKLSMSFGGGRGSSAPVGPNVSLTPQTFAPWESTYTPPTPATPVPYDYATRSPYVYGDGLSNAGAAYDIWGSKPGTNPYLLSTPAGYTPGILGLDPVTLPGNMPNKGANINGLSNVKRQKFTGTPNQIIRDYGYTGRVAPNQTNVPPSMRDSAPNAKIMLEAAAANVRNGRYPNMQAAMDAQQAYNLKYPTLTPAENKAQIAKSQKLMEKNYVAPPKYDSKEYKTAEKNKAALAASRGAFEGASGPMPGQTTYASKKANTAKAIKKYTTKDVSTSYKARRDVRNLFA